MYKRAHVGSAQVPIATPLSHSLILGCIVTVNNIMMPAWDIM